MKVGAVFFIYAIHETGWISYSIGHPAVFSLSTYQPLPYLAYQESQHLEQWLRDDDDDDDGYAVDIVCSCEPRPERNNYSPKRQKSKGIICPPKCCMYESIRHSCQRGRPKLQNPAFAIPNHLTLRNHQVDPRQYNIPRRKET